MPFAIGERDGVRYYTLDTPGSAINIFNHATSQQLVESLATVTPENTRAIVFQTAKSNSFINGVGLLLAHASQTEADIIAASQLPWAAYRAVREAPVPTISVIQGSCFGCGVEFALNCDFRIASDSGETDFYMTELNDYLFIPLFGSTWNLPEAVGLDHAIDLLLWGRHWNAETAVQRGLVDEVAPAHDLAERRDRFVERVLVGEQPSRKRGRIEWSTREARILEKARERVHDLPPAYHRVYEDGLTLLENGAKQTRPYLEHQSEELACSAASATAAIGKSAYAFFYIRQMAAQRARGRQRDLPVIEPIRLQLEPRGSVSPLLQDLQRRTISGVRVVREHADVCLLGEVSPSAPGELTSKEFVVRGMRTTNPTTTLEILVPWEGSFVEVAASPVSHDASHLESVDRLVETLQRFGYEIARTRPVRDFTTIRFLRAFFGPLVGWIAAGVSAPEINGQLRMAGFVRRPHEAIDRLGIESLVAILAQADPASGATLANDLSQLTNPEFVENTDDMRVMDSLTLSLLNAVVATRSHQETADVATIDLIAREILDFPRHLCSLCRWLKKQRIETVLARSSLLGEVLSEDVLATARAFVASGREFYR